MGTMPWMGNMGTNGNQGLGITIVAMLQEMQGSAVEKQRTLMSIGLS